MERKRFRTFYAIAAVSLGIVIAVAACAVFAPRQNMDFPAEPPYVPAEYVYVTPSGSKYHREDCSTIKSSKKTERLSPSEAAEKGYAPCLTCKP